MSWLTKGKTTAPPDWATKLVSGVTIRWHYHPSGKNCYGAYASFRQEIHIHTWINEPTNEIWMVLLHEYAHYLAPRRDSEKSWHGPRFWEQAARLYTKHGILAHAAINERYANGRKFLVEYLADN